MTEEHQQSANARKLAHEWFTKNIKILGVFGHAWWMADWNLLHQRHSGFKLQPRTADIAGIRLCDVAKTVSGITSDNCHKMKHQGFWCDALFMHCLANSCQADVIIYNLDGPQTLVGSAIHGIETELIVPVVLSEHYHWWAVIPAEKDPGAVQVVAKSWDIALRLCVACFLRSCFRHTSNFTLLVFCIFEHKVPGVRRGILPSGGRRRWLWQWSCWGRKTWRFGTSFAGGDQTVRMLASLATMEPSKSRARQCDADTCL